MVRDKKMLSTIVISVIVILAIIISYIFGKVSGIPDNYCPCYERPCNFSCDAYCGHCQKCCSYDYISKTMAKINEEQAYQKGKYEAKLEAMNDIRFTRFMSMSDQEKFLKRFNECVKPIEELRKDLEVGKF